jgi:hypothetical protein
MDKMEKLLQPPKQEGFTEEIWKSQTSGPDAETDLLSDGESLISPKHSPVTHGAKRTADGEIKETWENTTGGFPQVKVETPLVAMPHEAREDATDGDDEFKPSM